MNYYESHCFKGDLLSPCTQSEDQSGTVNNVMKNGYTPLEHLTGGASKQLSNWFLWFHQNSFLKNACCLGVCPLSPPLSETVPLLVFPFVFVMQIVASGRPCGFIGCWFSILSDVFSQTLELLTWFFHFSPSLSLPPCFSRPPSPPGKPREIDKQQDRGNWAILFLLWEPYFAAFIWKLSFSTSLGKSSHRPVTPKCLCWSIVPVSYWHAHWQLSLSTGIRNGSQLQSVQAAWEAGRAPRWYWHCKWRQFT